MVNSWNEITLGQELRLEEIYSDNDIADEDKALEAIAVLSNESVQVIESMSFNDFYLLVNQLEFLKHKPKFRLVNRISVNKNSYTVLNDISQITTGQYFDLLSLQKVYSETQDREVLYRMIAIFLRPDSSKEYLDNYSIEDILPDIEQIPYAAVEGLITFFFTCQKKFITVIVNYLMKQMKMTKTQRKTLIKNLEKNKISHTALLETLGQLQHSH